MATGQEIVEMRHSQWIGCVAFSPEGDRLATLGADENLKLWHVPSGQQILSINTGYTHPRWVCFSNSGTSIAAAQDLLNKTGLIQVFRSD